MTRPARARAAAAAAVLSIALAAAADTAAAPKTRALAAGGKATTIAELAARYDSSSCVECHQEAHDQWARSVHSRSIFGTGRTAATFMTAIRNGLMDWPASGVKSPKDVRVEHLMGCAKCHLPQLADATDAVAQEIVSTIQEWQAATEEDDAARIEKARKTLTSVNINCLVCHNRNAVIHKWTDGFPQKDTVYGSQAGEHADPKFPKMAKGLSLSESIFCGQCHGQGPNFELPNPTQCATGYGSYLFAYIPEGGDKTCQQCHMRESGLGHDMQSYRSAAMAKAAVDMRVEAQGVLWRDNRELRPKATVRVELRNNAGHGIPDG
jgi:hypothetical protein